MSPVVSGWNRRPPRQVGPHPGKALHPRTGWRAVRVVKAYRRAQERLRGRDAPADLANLQLDLASRETGYDAPLVRDCIRRWMEEAMGIRGSFDAVISAHDATIGLFKPHPRMFAVALRALGVPASEALCAGDRPEVDGVAAANAGIGYVNVVRASCPYGITLAELLAALRCNS